MIDAVNPHLRTSTIVLLLAFAIARFAPRLTARTRYAVRAPFRALHPAGIADRRRAAAAS